jgi:hypothetical protein
MICINPREISRAILGPIRLRRGRAQRGGRRLALLTNSLLRKFNLKN